MDCSFLSNVYLGLIVSVCFALVASDERSDIKSIPNVADDAKVSQENKTVHFEDDNSPPNTEQELDKEWNPKGIRLTDNPADWPGQLMPFGSIGKTRDIDIYKKFPKPSLFFSDYVAPYIPLLMRNASRTNEAFAQWGNDTYFLIRPQSRTHWMPLSPTADITFHQFIQRYKKDKLVFEDEIPFFLVDHIPLPSPLLCEPIIKIFSNTMLYIGGQDQQNAIVQRKVDTIRCVYAGSQDFAMVSHLDFGDKMPGNFRLVDVKQVDYVKYPTLREVAYLKGSLNRGDCIYIPANWYWQVNSNNSSKSVDAMWYHKVKHVESAECMVTAVEPNIGKAVFQEQTSWTAAWKYVALHYFSSYLLLRGSYDFKSFSSAIMNDKKLFKNITVWNDEYEEIAKEAFAILDINNDKSFGLTDLDALTPTIIEEIRGHLEDRMADFQDVMNDQQLEMLEDQAITKQGKDSLPILKPGADPKLAVENYINNYLKVLEDVITESMDEVTATGQVPDFKEKLARRQAEIDGEVPFIPKGKPQSTGGHKTAKEEAKAKIKAKQEKEKSTESEKEEFSDSESYAVVDDSVVEEILADDDDEDEVVPKQPDSKRQGTQKQQTKEKTAAKPKDKETKPRPGSTHGTAKPQSKTQDTPRPNRKHKTEKSDEKEKTRGSKSGKGGESTSRKEGQSRKSEKKKTKDEL